MEFDIEKFNKIKEKAEDFYKTIGEIYCPYLKEKIKFNAKGLEHIKFKARNKARSRNDQYMRFKLIHLAPEVIKLSHTVQGLNVIRNFELQKINSRWDRILKDVCYYEFVAVINKARVRVIIKQIDSGQNFFWSIIPFWRMNKELKKRMLHNGNPEID